MKIRKRTTSNIFTLITALFICVLMCFCMSACGDDSNTEETVEITTPSEETTAPADDENTSGDEVSDENSSGSSDSKDSASGKIGSEYEKIYKDCDAEMKDATDKYVKELKEKASSVSKSTLYDETQDRIDGLKKIYDASKTKMVDAMLESTRDDAKSYKKYFDKMTQAYTDYTRDLTQVYMDAF